MLRKFSPAAATFAAVFLVVCCQAAEPAIEVAGVQVVRQEIGDDYRGLRPFNSQHKGTQLALFVRSSDASIINVDISASEVEAFVDDTRQSLIVGSIEKGGFGNQEGYGQFPKISEDGKSAMVTITGKGVPASGASKIGLKGTLVVQLGGESKAFKSDPVELKKGVQVSVDDIDFKVVKIGKPGFGDFASEISIQSSSKSLSMLKGAKFFDADGKEIESKSSGSTTMGFLGNYTYGLSYRLKQKLDGKTQVEFEKWTDLREEKIAISVSAGIGG